MCAAVTNKEMALLMFAPSHLQLRNVAHDTPFMLQECLDAACEENPDLMALVDANGVVRCLCCAQK